MKNRKWGVENESKTGAGRDIGVRPGGMELHAFRPELAQNPGPDSFDAGRGKVVFFFSAHKGGGGGGQHVRALLNG